MDSSCIQCVIICYCYYLFVMLTLSQIWPVGSPSSGSLPFEHNHFVCSSFFFFWHKKMLQAHLGLFQLQLWNQTFLQRFLVPFSREWSLEAKT